MEIKNLKLQNAQFGRAIQDNFGFFSRRFAYLLEIEEYLEALTKAINWCEEFVNVFGIAFTSLAQGKIRPSLFPPDALEKALTQITTVLPRGYTLTASTKKR